MGPGGMLGLQVLGVYRHLTEEDKLHPPERGSEPHPTGRHLEVRPTERNSHEHANPKCRSDITIRAEWLYLVISVMVDKEYMCRP